MRPLAVWLPAALTLLPTTLGSQTVISDEGACGECMIRIDTVAVLGQADGPGSLAGPPVSVAVDANGRFWVLDRNSPPMVFDAEGRFLQTVGGMGPGPNEFQFPLRIAPLPGDSVLVLDLGRAAIIGPDMTVQRSIRMPAVDLAEVLVLAWPERVITNVVPQTGQAGTSLLHLNDFSGDRVVTRTSFGGTEGRVQRGQTARRLLAASSSGNGFWVTNHMDYRIQRWDGPEDLRETLERRPSWFRGAAEHGLGRSSGRPTQIWVFDEDEDGRLWTFSWVPKESGQERQPDPEPERRPASGAVRSDGSGIDAIFDTRLEVIDPAAERLLVSETLPYAITWRVDRQLVGAYSEDGMVPRVVILRVQLIG